MKRIHQIPVYTFVFIISIASSVGLSAQDSRAQVMLAKNVKTAGAEEGVVKAELLIGNLNIVSDETQYFSVNECIYYEPENEPVIEYEIDREDKEASFFISNRHLKSDDYDEDDHCTWNLIFNESIAMDYSFFLGAGSSRVNLSNSNVERFSLEMKAGEAYIDLTNTPVKEFNFKTLAGEATIDLSGEKTEELHAVIKGGVGELKLILPDNYKIAMSVSGLLGDISAPAFVREGRDYYRSPENRESDIMLIIEIKGGIGEVKVQVQ